MKKSLVYTKTGDTGKTSLVGGKRVEKTHVRLEAYGTIDELNSFVGFLACQINDEETAKILYFIQNKLFSVGGYLATETEAIQADAPSTIKEEDITVLEKEIDKIDNILPKLKQFVLPGGSEASARAHICRTVCRRAERNIYKVKLEYPVEEQVSKFVNRLSDYFFLLARFEANRAGTEIFWDKSCM